MLRIRSLDVTWLKFRIKYLGLEEKTCTHIIGENWLWAWLISLSFHSKWSHFGHKHPHGTNSLGTETFLHIGRICRTLSSWLVLLVQSAVWESLGNLDVLHWLKRLVYLVAMIDLVVSALDQFLIDFHSIFKHSLCLLNIGIPLHHRWNPRCPDLLIAFLILTGGALLLVWKTFLSLWEWSYISSEWSGHLRIQILCTYHRLWV